MPGDLKKIGKLVHRESMNFKGFYPSLVQTVHQIISRHFLVFNIFTHSYFYKLLRLKAKLDSGIGKSST